MFIPFILLYLLLWRPSQICASSSLSSSSTSNLTACGVYIQSAASFEQQVPPQPISCKNQTYAGWGPPEHQALSCCSDVGRISVQLGLVGGFDSAIYLESNSTNVKSASCSAYTSALLAVLCDPQQGRHVVVKGTVLTLRVCRESCNAVYDACGHTNYTNGTEFCRQAWGGFEHDTPCDGFPDQVVCRSGLELAIVDDDCLSLIKPSSAVIASYEKSGLPPNACVLNEADPVQVGIIVGAVVAGALLVAGVGIWWILRRRNAKMELETD